MYRQKDARHRVRFPCSSSPCHLSSFRYAGAVRALLRRGTLLYPTAESCTINKRAACIRVPRAFRSAKTIFDYKTIDFEVEKRREKKYH